MIIEQPQVINFLFQLRPADSQGVLPDARNVLSLFANALQQAQDREMGKQIIREFEKFVKKACELSHSKHYLPLREAIVKIGKRRFGSEFSPIALNRSAEQKAALNEAIHLWQLRPEQFSHYAKRASANADFTLFLNVPDEGKEYAEQSEQIREQVNKFNWLVPLLLRKNARIHLKLTTWNPKDLEDLKHLDALTTLELDIPSWSILLPANDRIGQILDKLIATTGNAARLEKLSIATRLLKLNLGFYKRVLAEWGDEKLEARLLAIAEFPCIKNLYLENYSRPLEGIFPKVEEATLLAAGLYTHKQLPNYAYTFPNAKKIVVSSSEEVLKADGGLGKCLIHPKLESLTLYDWRPPSLLRNRDWGAHIEGKVAFPIFDLKNCEVGPHLKTLFIRAMAPLYLDGRTLPLEEILEFINQHPAVTVMIDSLQEDQKTFVQQSLAKLPEKITKRIRLEPREGTFTVILSAEKK